MVQHPRRILLELYRAGLEAVAGDRAVRRWLAAHPQPEPLALVALGKAAAAMARGALEELGDQVREALVVTKYGHDEGLAAAWPRVQLLEAGHPEPDSGSLAAGRRLVTFLQELPPQRKVLFLISGGTSALVELPERGLEFADLVRINRWLLGSGLSIDRMNAVRRRISALKGGKLLQYLRTRLVEVLLISDVRHDDPAVIAAGLLHPLEPQPPLPELPRWLVAQLPPPVARPCPCPPHHLVATLEDALKAVATAAQARGLAVRRVPQPLEGDARSAGEAFARQLAQGPPGLLLQGGETTVVLPSQPGKGGRNQHLALAAACSLAGRHDLWVLAAGTDGSDGPTEEAGALVDGGTLARARAAGFDPERALARADSGALLEASGDLIRTGPTGTNVTDLLLGLRLPAEAQRTVGNSRLISCDS